MAEAVRRFRETGGSDVVRRLIARPIRLDPPRMPARMPVAAQVWDEPVVAFAETADAAAAYDADDVGDDAYDAEDEADDGDVVERLQAEMALMKAILMAERAESAVLRARIERAPEPDPIGAEARATRDRWAGMVDRMLISAR